MSVQSPVYISIIMPAYNAEVTIEASIRSVIRQTYPYFELIVIDDGSKDETARKIEAIANQDNRIRLLCMNKNAGVAAARNRGIKEASYDWIAFLDSDDLWTEDKLEKQVNQMKAEETSSGFSDFSTGSSADASTSGSSSVITSLASATLPSPDTFAITADQNISGSAITADQNISRCAITADQNISGSAITVDQNIARAKNTPSLYYTGSAFIDVAGHPLSYILHVPSTMNAQEILKQNLISCSSVIIRKDIMLRHPMPTDRMKPLHEDFATWIGILRDEGPAAGLDEPLLIYRLQKKSKSSNKGKAAVMHWNAMRMNHISLPRAIISMFFYMERGLRKYKAIKSK